MVDYKIMLGHHGHKPFFCEHCAVGEQVMEITSFRGRIIKKAKVKEPGKCSACSGTGKSDTGSRKTCSECGGTGVCPVCNGNYSRAWSDLPITAQAQILSRMDTGDDLLAGYEPVFGLYRQY